MRGHGPGQETLQVGKRDVTINELEPVGHYAIKPTFSDGHDSGIYAWDYLYELGMNQEQLWSEYLERLEAAGASREPSADTGDCRRPELRTSLKRPRPSTAMSEHDRKAALRLRTGGRGGKGRARCRCVRFGRQPLRPDERRDVGRACIESGRRSPCGTRMCGRA